MTTSLADPPALAECRRCQEACLDAVTHAVRRGDHYSDDVLIGALLDAADVCRISIDFIHRGSHVHARIGAVCAEICERAAEACDALPGDPVMAACAAACRRCAAACEALADESPADERLAA